MVERSLKRNGTYALAGLDWVGNGTAAAAQAPDRRFRSALSKDRPQSFLFSSDFILADLLRADSPSDDSDAEVPDPLQRISASALAYIQIVSFVQEYVSRILRRVEYLGPLRAAPLRSYELPSVPVTAVGSKGEHTAEVFCSGSDEYRARVNEWLATVEPDLKIECVELAPNGVVALQVRYDQGLSVNMTDVGFGLGQVLPIAVAALAQGDLEGQTLVMEQPEIHLNSRVQTRLADLVVTMAESSKRAYVETHSEHFLTRLRTRVAQVSPIPS